MSSIDFLCRTIGINPSSLRKEEVYLLEIILFFSLCEELSKFYQSKFKNSYSTKNSLEKDDVMAFGSFIHLILQDLIRSDDYTVLGVATYTQIPEEIIYDIAMGKNTNPSLDVSRKIVELHRLSRSELYQHVIQKIAETFLEPKNIEEV